MIVFDWHGGLQRAQRGVEMQLRAGVTHVGTPMHHGAGLPHVRALRAAGLELVRTLEPPWNAGRETVDGGAYDLGRILLDYRSPRQCGSFFAAFRAHLEGPATGIGWNMEHDPAEIGPATAADVAWATEVGIVADDQVALRGAQYSLLARLYLAVAEDKLGAPLPLFLYCGYAGLSYSRSRATGRVWLPVREAYSCDWDLLGRPATYRGRTYPPADYAVACWSGVALPAVAHTGGVPTLHCLGLPVYADPAARWRDYLAAAVDRLRWARATGGGLALVACSDLRGPWDAQEDRLRVILSQARQQA